MAVYLVTYDLNKQKDYPKLYEAIKSAGTDWCHPLDSTWFIVSTAGSVAIRDYIKKFMDSDDSLLVLKIEKPGDGAWTGLSQEVTAWLQSRLA